MKFFFYSPVHFERWDWRSSVERGIGGSETSQVEMAWRLARRGHDVTCYAPLLRDCPTTPWRDTKWRDIKKADFTQDGLWILYRCPEALDEFGERRPEQPRWLMCQDNRYPQMTKERAAKLDRVIVLCREHHAQFAEMYPYLKDKLWITQNGVKQDLLRQVLQKPPARNPFKIMYASSPDRGLVPLLDIFKRARQIVPELELHAFYGFERIAKLLKSKAPWARMFKGLQETVQKAAREIPGFRYRGLVSQPELYREWMSAGLWVYPTDFPETSCITSMEAMALGAVPITRPLWALADNIRHGAILDGSPEHDPLVRARYVGEIVRFTKLPLNQERLRPPMMSWAQGTFNWERAVDQWEADLLGLPVAPGVQFTFQHKHATGRILNIGCDSDASGFRHRGAVNLDVVPRNPVNQTDNAYHVLHDARASLPNVIGRFDTVVVGDVLEHMTRRDGVKVLRNAARALRPKGRIIVTVPSDHRPAGEQHEGATGAEQYTKGVHAFHSREISRADVLDQLRAAGLRPWRYEVIDYTFAAGHGVVADRRGL